MSRDEPLHLEDDGVLELLRDYEALRTWEVIRAARSVVTIASAHCRGVRVGTAPDSG